MTRTRVLLRRAWRPVASVVALLLLGCVAGAIGFSVQPTVSGPVGPGTVTVDPGVRRGDTVVAVPPLGEVLADTHRGPIAIEARVDRIDLESASVLARGANPVVEVRDRIEADLEPLLRRLAWRSAVAAVVAGVIAGLILPRRSIGSVAVVVVGAVGFVGASGAVAAATFDPASFDQPRFRGALEQAPDVIATVQRHIDDVEVVESRLAALSDRIVGLYRTVEGETAPDQQTTTILHVSDLHSNPVGIELVEETARRFGVDAIVDTGDLTSFGADIEVAVVDRIAAIDIPYYVVPGNHDSLRMRSALRAGGVEVLDPGVVSVGDVEILGFGDPVFTADNDVPRALHDRRLDAAGDELRRLVLRARPDVVAVHNSRQLRASAGWFPVGLAGHVHEPRLAYEAGGVVLHAGSAGATGVKALYTEEDLPYQMQLLHFEDDRLVALDRMEFQGTDGAFQLERILIDPAQISDYPDEPAGPGPLLRQPPE